jgi:glycolate oxidase iron-sulfur subunit
MGDSWPEIYEHTLDCVHCGLCLPVCPTYRETGRESSSPRGRIYMFRAVAEGRTPLNAGISEEAYLCLGCRACETACPSGVEFGSMLELARAEVNRSGLRRSWATLLERWALRGVVARPRRLSWLMSLLRVVQALRIDRFVTSLLPKAWREFSALAPRVPPVSDRKRLPEWTPALGKKRGRVAFFEGCVMPELFGAVNAATVRVLARNGFDVVVPSSQGCCGALHAHAGDLDFARELSRKNIAAFSAEDFDAVLVNSAGCGAALRELEHWLPGEGAALASRVRDVSEFLHAVGLRPPAGRLDSTVCYDDPCHLIHGQKVVEAPRRLLEQIPGLKLASHDDAESCCGAAGIYNLTHPEMSRAILDRKMKSLAEADPEFIASGNPGCIMQLRSGVRSIGARAEVVHPVELLDRSYARGEATGNAQR